MVGRKQKHLIVTPNVHTLVKLYAKEHKITLVEATYKLLRIGFTVTESGKGEE